MKTSRVEAFSDKHRFLNDPCLYTVAALTGLIAPLVSILLYAFLVIFFWYPGRALAPSLTGQASAAQAMDSEPTRGSYAAPVRRSVDAVLGASGHRVRQRPRELPAGLCAAFAYLLPGREELCERALAQRFNPDRRELFVRRPQLRSRVDAATLAAQPLSVQQARARARAAGVCAPAVRSLLCTVKTPAGWLVHVGVAG